MSAPLLSNFICTENLNTLGLLWCDWLVMAECKYYINGGTEKCEIYMTWITKFWFLDVFSCYVIM